MDWKIFLASDGTYREKIRVSPADMLAIIQDCVKNNYITGNWFCNCGFSHGICNTGCQLSPD